MWSVISTAWSDLSWVDLLGFLCSVVLAAWIQNLTGFAFGLVLLGGNALLTNLAVVDVAGAVTLLTLWQGWLFLRHHRVPGVMRSLRPAVAASLLGVGVGVLLLLWMSRHAVDLLQLLLGVIVVAASIMLWGQNAQRKVPAGPGALAFFGLTSGVMGGLFSAAGPPLVWLMYRQPLSIAQVRSALTTMFMINQGARLLLLFIMMAFSWKSAVLSMIALPVIWLVARLHRRWSAHWPADRVRPAVAALLMLSGLSMAIPVLRAVV